MFVSRSPTTLKLIRHFTASSCVSTTSVIDLKRTNVFAFGSPTNDPNRALFRDLDLTIADSDCWAIVSSSTSPNRAALLATLLGEVRYDPIQPRSHPILQRMPRIYRPPEAGGPREPSISDVMQLVSFKTRLGSSGDFQDYTARYYAIRDEDKLTTEEHFRQSAEGRPRFIRDNAKPEASAAETPEEVASLIQNTSELLQISHLLPLPLITLSNGQTRRARIVVALLREPELLILEEPFTGLDAASRGVLVDVLRTMHGRQAPRIVLVLRPQDTVPDFVTHIAFLGDNPGEITLGPRDEVLGLPQVRAQLKEENEREKVKADRWAKSSPTQASARASAARSDPASKSNSVQLEAAPIIELSDVNVIYDSTSASPRHVLKHINWTIREGERWCLAGHNGSGKSTLLSLILGDHPRSYTEDMRIRGQPRVDVATPTLQAHIGHVSPEIFNAFPRKSGENGLTVFASIVTGFHNVYSFRHATTEQKAQIAELIDAFDYGEVLTPAFLDMLFADLTPGEQSLVLLLRALAKNPSLIILDEVFSGMDASMVAHVNAFLDKKLKPHQALVVVSHVEEEIPDSVDRLMLLRDGQVVERGEE